MGIKYLIVKSWEWWINLISTAKFCLVLPAKLLVYLHPKLFCRTEPFSLLTELQGFCWAGWNCFCCLATGRRCLETLVCLLPAARVSLAAGVFLGYTLSVQLLQWTWVELPQRHGCIHRWLVVGGALLFSPQISVLTMGHGAAAWLEPGPGINRGNTYVSSVVVYILLGGCSCCLTKPRTTCSVVLPKQLT